MTNNTTQTFDDLLNEATQEIESNIYDEDIENIEVSAINAETVKGKSGTGNQI